MLKNLFKEQTLQSIKITPINFLWQEYNLDMSHMHTMLCEKKHHFYKKKIKFGMKITIESIK